MSTNAIHMSSFSSAFTATDENTVMISQHKCVDSRIHFDRWYAAGLIDSSKLMDRFELIKNCEYKVEIRFYDYSSDSAGLSEATQVSLSVEGCSDESFPISPNSPLRNLFTPEYRMPNFRGQRMRRSAYCELHKYLQKKYKPLYFSAIMKYETSLNSEPGDGLITILVNLPPYNYTFGHLEANKLL